MRMLGAASGWCGPGGFSSIKQAAERLVAEFQQLGVGNEVQFLGVDLGAICCTVGGFDGDLISRYEPLREDGSEAGLQAVKAIYSEMPEHAHDLGKFVREDGSECFGLR